MPMAQSNRFFLKIDEFEATPTIFLRAVGSNWERGGGARVNFRKKNKF